jgi:plastocyanin
MAETTNSVIKQIAPVGRTTDHVVLTPDGSEIWAQSNADHAIWVIDTETDEVKQIVRTPNDGDVHGGAFVRYSGAGTAEVLSDIAGLRGSAAKEQLAYLTNPTRYTVAVTRDGLLPNVITAKPGSTLTLKFVQSAGTGRNVGVEAPTLGIARFSLRPGETRTVQVAVPNQPGNYPVLDPTNRNAVPLIVTVKEEVAAGPAPSATAGGIREVSVVGKNITFDVKAITGRPGETIRVTLVNQDDEPHNIVGIEARLSTDLIQPNRQGTSTWKLPGAGTYKLFCTVHPSMIISLEVK